MGSLNVHIIVIMYQTFNVKVNFNTMLITSFKVACYLLLLY
jgi:hypothetical protein